MKDDCSWVVPVGVGWVDLFLVFRLMRLVVHRLGQVGGCPFIAVSGLGALSVPGPECSVTLPERGCRGGEVLTAGVGHWVGGSCWLGGLLNGTGWVG